MFKLADILDRLRFWSLPLPSSPSGSQIQLHSSLLIAIPACSAILTILSLSSPAMYELRWAAITMPLVWLASLAVRVAAQQLALGAHANRFETVVGPAGNLSTDYEELEGPLMFSYGMSGQLATFCLAILGFVVSAAVAPTHQASFTAADLLDFKCGWDSHAWASQIMWLNLFIASLHVLPTFPFDMRASFFALCKIRYRRLSLVRVYRSLGSANSHLSCLFMGIGVTCGLLEWNRESLVTGWYIFITAAVYLFVSSRWEHARAAEIDEPMAAIEPISVVRRDTAHAHRPDSHFGSDNHFVDSDSSLSTSPESSSSDSRAVAQFNSDVDEILRKLHHQGHASLTPHEKETLLNASRRLKAKRKQ